MEEVDIKLGKLGFTTPAEREDVKEVLLNTFLTRHIRGGRGIYEYEIERLMGKKEIDTLLENMEQLHLLQHIGQNPFTYLPTTEGVDKTRSHSGEELAEGIFRHLIDQSRDQLIELLKPIPNLLFHLLCYHFHFNPVNGSIACIHAPGETGHYAIMYKKECRQFFEFMFPRDVQNIAQDVYFRSDFQILTKLKELKLIAQLELVVLETGGGYPDYPRKAEYYVLTDELIAFLEQLEPLYTQEEVATVIKIIQCFFPLLFDEAPGRRSTELDEKIYQDLSKNEHIIPEIIEVALEKKILRKTVGKVGQKYAVFPPKPVEFRQYLRQLVLDNRFWLRLLRGESPHHFLEPIKSEYVLSKNIEVFISYAIEDSQQLHVREIAEGLKQKSSLLTVHYFEGWDGYPKGSIEEFMRTNIGRSTIFLPFYTDNSNKSAPCQQERNLARDKIIIPLFKDINDVKDKDIKDNLGVNLSGTTRDEKIDEIFIKICTRVKP